MKAKKTVKKKSFKKKSIARKVPKKPIPKPKNDGRGWSQSKNPKLTAKEKFVCDLVVDGGMPKGRALLEAGMSPTQSGRFFAKANIKAYVDAKYAMNVAVKKHLKEMYLRELRTIGLSNITDYLEFGPDGVTLKKSANIDTELLRAIGEVSESNNGTIKIKLHNKTHALELLMKKEGMLIEKHEHSGDLELKLVPFEKFIQLKKRAEKELNESGS